MGKWPKYYVGERAWVMIDNVPTHARVKSVLIQEYKEEGIKTAYNFIRPTRLLVDPSELFDTKEELIDSLR